MAEIPSWAGAEKAQSQHGSLSTDRLSSKKQAAHSGESAHILAQSADGVIHSFPKGTKQEVIDRVMKEYAGSHPTESDLQSASQEPPPCRAYERFVWMWADQEYKQRQFATAFIWTTALAIAVFALPRFKRPTEKIVSP